MKTAQEVFDEVVEHLFNQGRRSFNEQESWCMYRGPEGTKCAVGALLPDDVCEVIEGLPVSSCEVRMVLPEEYRPFARCTASTEDNKGLLSSLQRAHDNSIRDIWADSDASFKAAFGRVARDFGLSFAKFENRTFIPYLQREATKAS